MKYVTGIGWAGERSKSHEATEDQKEMGGWVRGPIGRLVSYLLLGWNPNLHGQQPQGSWGTDLHRLKEVSSHWVSDDTPYESRAIKMCDGDAARQVRLIICILVHRQPLDPRAPTSGQPCSPAAPSSLIHTCWFRSIGDHHAVCQKPNPSAPTLGAIDAKLKRSVHEYLLE
jgi:hypothetical protein